MAKPVLAGKVAVVTGAGRGIGREEALLLAGAGARVVVNDLGGEWDGSGRDDRPAAAVVAEIHGAGGEAIPHFGDISEPEGADSLVALALDSWGRLDIALNNAGILRDRMVFNMSLEDWDLVIKVHLRGHFLVTRAACGHFRERARAGDAGGRVINTTSPSGLLGNAGQGNYGAAKAGIAAFTQIVALEMGRYGVTCNAISPGARTRLTEKTFGELRKDGADFDALDPANIAPLALFLASDLSAGITGQVFGLQGGVLELFEGWRPGERVEHQGRWSADELAAAMPQLFAGRSTAYEPHLSVFFEDVRK
ncbi:MAG: SDR family oxidoreductase [Chloroflexi bacterium]|nr:MAG: SDR family oxidoreductase [Chloroflexota bacterium]